MKRKAAIIFFGTVFGLLLATVLVLQSKPFEEAARKYLVREAQAALYSQVEVARLQVRLLSLQPGIDLYDVKVTPKLPGSLPPFTEPTMRADRVRVVVRPLQPWARSIAIDRVELDGPHVDLSVRKGEIVGLPRPLLASPGEDAGSGGAGALRIDAFLVRNGIVHFDADDPDLEVGLTRIKALGTIEPNGSVVVDFGSSGRRVRMRVGEGNFEEFVSELEGQIAINGSTLDIRSSRVVTDNFHVEASGAVALSGGTDVKLASLRAIGPLPFVNEIVPKAPALTGVLDFHGSLSVVGSKVRARGNAKVPDFRLDRFKLGDVDADLDLVGSRARAKRLVLTHAGGKIEGTAELSWPQDELRLAADVQVADVSFAQVLDALGVEEAHVDSRVSGHLAFEGPLAPSELRGTADLAHHDFVWRDRPWSTAGAFRKNLAVPAGRIGGGFEVHEDGIRFVDLAGSAGSSRIEAGGELAFAGAVDLSFSCAPLALGELSPLGAVEVSGTGPATGRVHGAFEELAIEGTLDLDGMKVAGFDFGRGTGRILFKDLVLASERTVFARGRSTYAGPWEVDFNEPLSLAFDVETKAARVEDLADVVWGSIPASEWAQGEVSGSIRLAGPIDALSGHYAASASDLRIAGERFARLKATGRWKDGTIFADDIVATKPSGATVYLRGSLAPPVPGEEALGGPVNVEMHTSKLAFSDLDFLGEDAAMTSDVVLRTHVGGRFYRPTFRGRLDLAGTEFLGMPFGATQADFETVASAAGPGATLDLLRVRTTAAGGTVQGETRIRLDRTNGLPFDADLRVERHSLKPYFLYLNPLLAREEDATAQASGDVRLAGALMRASEVAIATEISSLRIARGPHEVKNAAPFSLTIDGDRIDLRGFSLKGDETDFRVHGGRTADGRLDFRADGALDLAFVPLLTGALKRVEGIAHVRSLAITGSAGAVDVDGVAEIERGVFKNRFFPLSLEDVVGRIHFSEDRVRFERVSGRANGGLFEGSGQMDLAGAAVRHWDLRARLTDVPIRFASVMLGARGSGDLQFEGPSSNPILAGSVELSEARFSAPFDWKAKAVSWKQQRQIYAAPTEEARLFGLNLVLRADDNIWVKNDLLNTEWRISREDPLLITGDTAQWGLLGTIEAMRGKATFQGDQEFTLNSGTTVEFDSMRTIDGKYNVDASTVLRDWEIKAKVEGRISTGPQIDYTSTPPLPREDITFLLLTGLTQQEASEKGAGALVGFLGTTVVQGLGEQRGVTRRLKEVTGLEAVEIVPTYGEGGEMGVKAVVRKQLNPDLTISGSVGHSGSDKTTGNAQADYRVNKRLHLVGGWTNEDTTGDPNAAGELLDEGEVSIDAKFRFEWK